MFKGKLTQDKKKTSTCKTFNISTKGNIKKITIFSKIALTRKQQVAILRIVKSDLRNEKFDEDGLTTLQIQLLLGVDSEERIVLRKNSIQVLVIIN